MHLVVGGLRRLVPVRVAELHGHLADGLPSRRHDGPASPGVRARRRREVPVGDDGQPVVRHGGAGAGSYGAVPPLVEHQDVVDFAPAVVEVEAVSAALRERGRERHLREEDERENVKDTAGIQLGHVV